LLFRRRTIELVDLFDQQQLSAFIVLGQKVRGLLWSCDQQKWSDKKVGTSTLCSQGRHRCQLMTEAPDSENKFDPSALDIFVSWSPSLLILAAPSSLATKET
jgi:hypothetical protein